MTPKHLSAWLLALCVTASTLAAATNSLETGFLMPPQAAKPQTWWHWMNGNITKEGITADLEAMRQIGLGGATVVNVDNGIPAGPVPFLSPAWRDCFKFAVQEADRLGLELTVENCAGWSSSGGPWNTVTNAMQRVTLSEVRVTGPGPFSAVLPQPPTKLDFYRDIAVLAFPAAADETARMSDASPVASSSGPEQPAARLTDGDPATVTRLPVPVKDKPQWLQLEFREPFAARTLKVVIGHPLATGGGINAEGDVLISDDGKQFTALKPFALRYGRRDSATALVSLGAQPVAARYWRLQFKKTSSFTQVERDGLLVADIELMPRLFIENLDNKTGDSERAGISSVAPTNAVAGAIPRRSVIDLTSHLSPEGKLDWQVPAGEWIILRLGSTPTGARNHPAPPEGTGLECDKFSKSALDAHWAGFMQKILDDVGPLAGKALTTSLIDSYEVGGQNWSSEFRSEFKKRRGYDLLPYMPTFTGRIVDNPAVTERFLWDVRRTIADLFAENYFGHFATLCRERGLKNAVEPYTGPFDSLQCGAPADVVMGEFWAGSEGHSSIKLAASIAHIYGKTLVGAESFTAKPEAGRWQNDPYSMKTLGDLVFCQGLNRYIFHRYAMQPWTNRAPGMTMGPWGFHFERTLTWWDQGKPWIDYISRCQFLLQQGRAVTDVAYFAGENSASLLRVGESALPAGYDFDIVNAEVLLHGATVKNGRLTLASGANYAVLVLPPQERTMTPPLLKRLDELVRAGATVVGPRPESSPSLADYPRCDAEVNQLAAGLWGSCDGVKIQENVCGQGRIVWGKSLASLLAAQNLKPDFEFTGSSNGTKLAATHRVDDGTDIYFVSNQRREFETAECTFRVSGKIPELWYPDTGTVEPAPVWSTADGCTTVRLTFDPAGSVFVIFRRTTNQTDHVVAVSSNTSPWQVSIAASGLPEVRVWDNGQWELRTAQGKVWNAAVAGLPSPSTLSGGWTLSFPPNWGAPASVTLDSLISWTDHTNAGVRYFSGTATYQKDIEIPAERLAAGRELWLDLGAVTNFAEVFLNGKSFGVLWKPPFRVNITATAVSGRNHLEIKVTNLWPNRLIGDEQLPPDCEWSRSALKVWPQWLLEGKPSPTGRFTFSTWRHWNKNDAPLTSGLLGPVTLHSATKAKMN